MTFAELQKQALALSVIERWQLITSLILSLKPSPSVAEQPKGIAASLVGIAKTDLPAPTDSEVDKMLSDRRAEKYLQ